MLVTTERCFCNLCGKEIEGQKFSTELYTGNTVYCESRVYYTESLDFHKSCVATLPCWDKTTGTWRPKPKTVDGQARMFQEMLLAGVKIDSNLTIKENK